LPGSDRKSPSRSRSETESSTRNTRRQRSAVLSSVDVATRPNADRPVLDSAGAALLNETILDRVVREVGVRLRIHLFENARTVRADRLVAEEELVRDVAHVATGRELAE